MRFSNLICGIIFVLQVLPTDKSGDFDMIYKFLKENWNIVKWVALGIVILEVSVKCHLLFL